MTSLQVYGQDKLLGLAIYEIKEIWKGPDQL